MYIQIQQAHKTPTRIKPKRTTARHIIIKWSNVKDKTKIMEEAKENNLSHAREPP